MNPSCVRTSVSHRRRWSFVSLGILAVLLAGCAVAAEPTPTPEPVTILLAFPADLDAYYDELIGEFNEQHPYVRVERRSVRSPEKWQSLFQEQEVDVSFFAPVDAFFQGLYDQGRLLNLTPFLQESEAIDLNDFYPDALSPFTHEGSVWGIPSAVNMGVTYYNQDLFDGSNVPYPQPGWTWDDLVFAGSAVSDPEQGVYGLVDSFLGIPFIYQHGGRLFDDPEMPTRTTLDDPLTIEAVEWYAGLVHEYEIMPSPAEAEEQFGNNGSPGYIFWRQKAGIYMGMLSDRGGLSWGPGAQWPMAWGMAPLPQDETAFTLAYVYGHAIAADTQHPEASWELMVFLNDRPIPYMMPARRSQVESAAFEEQVGAEAAAVARASVESMVVISGVPESLQQGLEGLGETLTAILNGDVPAEQALIELQRQAEAR